MSSGELTHFLTKFSSRRKQKKKIIVNNNLSLDVSQIGWIAINFFFCNII